jgi:hypothetical protein
MLSPEAIVVHRALRKTLLPRIGNAKSIISIQQWLLLHVMTSRPFNIMDFVLCEIEDVILDWVDHGQTYVVGPLDLLHLESCYQSR